MAPRKETSTETSAETNGPQLPQRTGTVAGGIPARVGRPRNSYAHWAPEIEALRTEFLGQTFEYANTEKCQTVAQGLRREFGVNAAGRNVDKETGVGTLYVGYPFVKNDDDTVTVDEDKVKEIMAKYAK